MGVHVLLCRYVIRPAVATLFSLYMNKKRLK
jgi:hypothetical protein